MEIRKFSHVMHLFSELSGELKDRQDTGNIIKACFPPGPVTGSPKIRAIEILDEIEKEGRGPYGGIVGLFGYDGAFDSTVIIRSLWSSEGKIYLQAGAGIIADSNTVEEYEECISKAKTLIENVRRAELKSVESI